MDKQKRMGNKGKLLFWFEGFSFKSEFSLHPLRFYLSIEAQFLRFFIHFLIYVFLLIKILTCDNTADNMVFKVFFVISFLPCVPAYHPCLTSSWSNVAQLQYHSERQCYRYRKNIPKMRAGARATQQKRSKNE